MTAHPVSWRQRWKESGGAPEPDTPGGLALAAGFAGGLVYLVLLVADYNAMTAFAWSVTSLSLILSVVGAFALSTMLGADVSNYQRLELDLARTALAYVGSGSAPTPESALAGVWRAYVGASEESRRVARAHAYGLGLFVRAGMISLAAVLLAALGFLTSTQNVVGLAMLVELFAFFFLVVGAAALVATVGFSAPVPGYEMFAAQRWKRNSGRAEAVRTSFADIPWLAEFVRGAGESHLDPTGPSVLPSWRE
ncbi:MAG: hypothetical protein ACLQD9_00595 [Thermoplasmata archaeon]